MHRITLSIPLLTTALLVSAPGAATAGYAEEWNDPAAGANDWFFFQTSATGEVHDGDVAMQWTGSAGGGYVSTDLSQASDWDVTTEFEDRYIAYTWDEFHSIDLTVDRFVNVMLRADGDPSNADLRFWIGEWIDDDNYGFYAFQTPLSVGTDWTLNSIETNGSDWEEIITKGSAPAVADLVTNPEQWGFAVYGSQFGPFTVDYDWLRVLDQAVPLPPTLMLMAPALLLLRRRRGSA